MCVAFINFNGALINTITNLAPNESEDDIDYSRSEFFQLKIYELYFVKHITHHFDRVFKFLVNKEEMYLSYIKFKNMYVVDLSTGEIIFDILALRNSNKNKKIYKNEKLWQEIIHHSKNLLENYKADFGNVYDNKDGFFRFVKFECTSTYPRLTFIIKFLPILKGISIIHMYSQKKLSRMSENNEQHLNLKGYKEIDLLYGSEVKNNNNIEFRYTEPRKLQEIENFFIEFFISIRSNSDIYHDINHELKYFDYSIITSINEILIAHREIIAKETNENISPQSKITSIDALINKINGKLYDNFLNINNNGAERVYSDDLKPIELNGGVERDTSNSYNFLLIKKEKILNELFQNSDKNDRSAISDNAKSTKSLYALKELNEENDVKKKVIITAKYIEHEDGWAMRTKGNGFGHDLININEDKKQISKLVIDHTINLSRNELQNHSSRDMSLEFSRKISIISKNEEDIQENINNNSQIKLPDENMSSSKDANMSILTLDYLMTELGTKNKNKELLVERLIKPPDEERERDNDFMNADIPTHNVFESLIKNKTKSIDSNANNSHNISQQAKLNFNLNLNIPLSNLNSNNNACSPNKVNNDFFRRESVELQQNKLSLFDAADRNNKSKETKRFHKSNVHHPLDPNNSMNRLGAVEYVQVSSKNPSSEGVAYTNNKLIDEADNEQSKDAENSISSSKLKKLKLK